MLHPRPYPPRLRTLFTLAAPVVAPVVAPVAALVVLVACLASAHLAIAQASAPKPHADADKAPAVLSLDLDRLIYNRNDARLSDKVWREKPQPGRRLVLIPFRVRPVTETTQLTQPPIKVRKARFVGFYIPQPDDRRGSRDEVDLLGLIDADAKAFGKLLLGEIKDDQPGDEGAASNEPSADPQAAEPEFKPVPEGAPRLARSLAFEPDGTVRWEMDRTFSSMQKQQAGSSNLYGYKLSPQELIAEQPDKPERITRGEGEDSRAYAQRRREQQLRDREAQQAFRELRSQVRDLPTEFREPTQPVVYAIFDAPTQDKIEFEGPSPLPWSLTTSDEERYQKLLQLNPTAVEDSQVLLSLVDQVKEEVLTARVVALGVARGGLAGKVKPDDAGFVLLEQLTKSSDPATHRLALYAIAQANPPSQATADLLQAAGQRKVGETRSAIQVAALGKLLEVYSVKPEDPGMLIAGVNQMLADPQGPGAARVIRRMIGVTANERGRGTEQPPDAILKQVRFDQVPAGQVDPVIALVVSEANTNALAAGWLGQNLLTPDSKLLDQTLAALAKHRPQPPQDEQQAQDPNAEPLTIPIASPEHGLVLALDSDSAARQKAAWAVLDRFHVSQPARQRDQAEAEDKPMTPTELLDLIVSKATDQEQTPATVIVFIEGQHDQSLQSEAPKRLVNLLAQRGVTLAVKKTIADRVLASEGAYTRVLRELEGPKCVQAVSAMYIAQSRAVPLAVGLIAADRSRMLDWLSGRIEKGELPNAPQWINELVSDESSAKQLVAQAASDDRSVSSGAAAALVMSMGGNAQEQAEFAQQLDAMQSPTAEEVQKAWAAYRTQILTRVFARAAGAYRLVVTVYDKPEDAQPVGGDVNAGDDDGAASKEPGKAGKRIEVGLVQLRAEGASVSLSVEEVGLSAVPYRLAIRIERLSALKSLESASLEKLPHDRFNKPLDMLPTEGGAWSGDLTLRDGRTISVGLEPVQ